jgi:hypothetical protein
MIAVLLSTLFTASALLAATTIAASWRRHGSAALALRSELDACPEWREVQVRIDTVTVRATATVLRGDFTARPAPRRALPAAA